MASSKSAKKSGSCYPLLLGLIVPLVIGIENLLYFFPRGEAKLGFIGGILAKAAKWIWDFLFGSDPNPLAPLWGVALSTALGLLIMYVLYSKYKALQKKKALSKSAAQLCQDMLGLTLLITGYPAMKLAAWMLRWLVYFILSWFVSGTDYSDCENARLFLAKPIIETPIIIIAALIWFWTQTGVYKKQEEAARAKQWEEITGPDGNRYSVPLTYEAGMKKFGSLHAEKDLGDLLVVSRTCDLIFAQLKPWGHYKWIYKTPVAGHLLDFADVRLLPDLKLPAFCSDTGYAAKNWEKRADYAKAAHYREMFCNLCCWVAASDAWTQWIKPEEVGEKFFEPLVELYRSGGPGVEPDLHKALLLQNAYEKFLADCQPAIKRADELYQKFKEERRKEAEAERSAAAYEAASQASSSEGSEGLSWLPDVMYDAAGHTYSRIGSLGSSAVSYQCAETGDSVLITVAAASLGSIYTNCGEFFEG